MSRARPLCDGHAPSLIGKKGDRHMNSSGIDPYRPIGLIFLGALTLCGVLTARYLPSFWQERTIVFSSLQDLRLNQPGGMTAERRRLLGLKIDLNTATAEELSQVKGIGPGLAPKVIRERERRERFENLQELLDVKGMGQKRLKEAGEYLLIRPH